MNDIAWHYCNSSRLTDIYRDNEIRSHAKTHTCVHFGITGDQKRLVDNNNSWYAWSCQGVLVCLIGYRTHLSVMY